MRKYLENNIDYIYIDHLSILSNDKYVKEILKVLTNNINEFKNNNDRFYFSNEGNEKYLKESYKKLTSIYILKDTRTDKI